ncbi:MAG TPA: ECF transporter S component [Candidatus Nanopelagicaceae bacterium]|nr:ECF transporter S component [Candidatus Nanopelagicaceae bacterium]
MNNQKFSRKPNFLGYLLPFNSLALSMIGLFGAFTCVVTMVIAFPIPATNGFINIGDAVVMITALIFGPIIGGIAGGVGSSLADLFLGYAIYAPATLVIKGLEGFFVGLIANPKKKYRWNYRDFIGVIVGGFIMIIGYFLYEVMIFGVPSALYEFILNSIIQFGLGSVIALTFIFSARKNIKTSLPQVFDKIYISPELIE